jgi:hypothetical protein
MTDFLLDGGNRMVAARRAAVLPRRYRLGSVCIDRCYPAKRLRRFEQAAADQDKD